MTKKSKRGKSRPGEKKKPSGKPRRKNATFGQRVLLILFGIFLLGFLEVMLRLLPLGVESPAESDPFLGFSATYPLFVPYRADDGSLWMITAPGKLRWFNEQRFKARKVPNTFRIFTLGGSTTYGRPYMDATSFSGWLRKLLSRVPESTMRYEVINAGGISYASYRVVKILEELLDYEPDLFVVYTGHNEFLEARTYGNLLDQPFLVFKSRELLSRLKIYNLLTSYYQQIRGKSETGSRAATNALSPEVQTILDRSAGLDYYKRDTLFSRGVFKHFHYNVARMKRLCRQAEVPILFLEPVDNIKDFSPFKSEGRADLAPQSRARLYNTVSEGLRFLAEGKYAEGIERLKEAVSIDSINANYFFFLGRSYLETGDTLAAGNYLLRARELDVCPLRAQQEIHRILRQQTVGSEDPDLLDLPGLFSQLSPGGLAGEEMLIDHIHPFPGGNLRIALEIQGWMNEQGFFPGDYFPIANELNLIYSEVMDSLPPEYARKGIINLSKVLIWAKKFREALTVLESQWEQLSVEGEAWYLMGSVLSELGAPHKALEHYQKALELTPDHIMLLVKLGPLYTYLGQVDSTLAVYERGLKLYPDNIILLTDYGVLLGQLGKTDKAIELLRRAQRLDPEAPGLNNNIGTVYIMTGEHEKAAGAFRQAVDSDPEDPEAYYNLGNLYVIQQRMEEAEKYFLKAIRMNPRHSGAHVNLGNIYQNTGRTALAEKQFRLALSINPALFAPYINLAKLYQFTGRIKLAGEIVQLGLQRFPDNAALKQLADEINSNP